MKTLTLKSIIITTSILLSSCGKKESIVTQAQEENLVLAGSAFYPGEAAAPVQTAEAARTAASVEPGVIPGSSNGSGTTDSGVIGTPSSPSPAPSPTPVVTSPSPATPPSPTPASTETTTAESGTNGSAPVSPVPSSTPNPGEVAPPSPPVVVAQNTVGDSGVIPSGSQTGGSDSGVLPAPNPSPIPAPLPAPVTPPSPVVSVPDSSVPTVVEVPASSPAPVFVPVPAPAELPPSPSSPPVVVVDSGDSGIIPSGNPSGVGDSGSSPSPVNPPPSPIPVVPDITQQPLPVIQPIPEPVLPPVVVVDNPVPVVPPVTTTPDTTQNNNYTPSIPTPNHNPTSCKKHHHKNLKITLSRTCSVRRSQSNALFFEESMHPVLAIEAIVIRDSCVDNRQLASMGWDSYLMARSNENRAAILLLKKVELSEVDLFEGKYTATIGFEKKTMKSTLGRYWKEALISAKVCDDRNGNGLCADEKPDHQLSIKGSSFSLDRIPNSLTLDVWNGRYLTRKEDPDYCDKQYSPLVLDLKGNGFSISSAENGVDFDLNATGEKIRTAWTLGSDDALLVRDINRNGQIDSGAELFGSATLMADGSRAPNGFEALRQFDLNQDNTITSKDAVFNELRLWIDGNHDGIAQASELQSLSRWGVQSINLKYIEMMEVDPYGNETRQRSTYQMVSGRQRFTRQIIDIWFSTIQRY